MLRSPSFNVQADYLEEVGAHGAAWCYPRDVPASQHKEKHGFAVMVASLPLVVPQRGEGTEGLMR